MAVKVRERDGKYRLFVNWHGQRNATSEAARLGRVEVTGTAMPTPLPSPLPMPTALPWMAANVAAIQAASAVVQAIAAILAVGITAWLACLTRQYVQLTRELVGAEAREGRAQRRHLWAIVKLLGWYLDELPMEPVGHAARKILQSSIWDDDDLRSLIEVSAKAVGPGEGILASSVAKSLGAIKNRIEEIRAAGTEYNWQKFDWAVWAADIKSAKETLAQLFVAAAQGSAQKESSETSDGR